MLHPSYTDLMQVINNGNEGDTPVVNSRYSIVLATAKRARQLVDGEEAFVDASGKKPLSVAVEEMSKGLVTIEPEEEAGSAEDTVGAEDLGSAEDADSVEDADGEAAIEEGTAE